MTYKLRTVILGVNIYAIYDENKEIVFDGMYADCVSFLKREGIDTSYFEYSVFCGNDSF